MTVPDRAAGVPAGAPAARADVLRRIDELVRLVPDYPQPGILFRDITPLLADAAAFADVIAEIAGRVDGPVDLVAGMEARGFLLAAPVAVALGAGVLPVRKAGKLPGPDRVGVVRARVRHGDHRDPPGHGPGGARVLVIDDVLATGGTAAATVALLAALRRGRRRPLVPRRARGPAGS